VNAAARSESLDPVPVSKAFLFDLDGTLLLSDRTLGGYEILPGATEVLRTFKDKDLPFVVLTNGSACPPAEQAAKLRKLGLPVDDEQMLTPSSVAADLMPRRGVKRALVLGTRGVGYALAEAGIEIVFDSARISAR
jgi:4-nitrophenyl phosphatase